MSLGLSGAVLLVVVPLAGSPAAGATVRTVLASPSEIPGCDVDPSGICEEPTPIVTVTITEEPPPEPQKTVTSTVIVPPKKTKAPKPTPTQQQQQQQETVQEPPPVQQTTPPPAVDPPPVTQAPPTQGPEEQDVQFPPNSPQATPEATPPPAATPSETATFDDGASGAVYEIRNAGSEFDGATLSRQLGIPALILVLLVLFAVLIFEGRLRRLAHAAAIRRAGPRVAGRRGEAMDPMMYPAGSAFVPAHYQSGTAYAPIISLVPMQMYGPPYPEGHAPEQYPHGYEQSTAYMPAPGYGQPGGYVDPYGRTVTGPAGPPDPHGPAAAFQGPPSSVPGPGERDFPRGEAAFPGAPFPQEPPRGAMGSGGPSGSFQDAPRDDFKPFGPASHDVPGSASAQDRPFADGLQDAPRPFGPEPRDAGDTSGAPGERPVQEPSATAVYPLQGQGTGPAPGTDEGGPGESTGKKRRGLFRRSS
ncbi:hypothetical protein ACLQ2R_28195 [Streptosporangium sp. DT93]|uniref:hypothetical protein n=1 Tax=Streptosporangium sp. DT93 TaxID=3393428 RepID=UPI003CE774E8